MNASDSHPEPEIAELAQLLPVLAERDLAADRHLLLKEHLMADIHAASPGFHAVRWPRAGRGVLAFAAGLAVLAIVLAATALGALTRSGGTVNPFAGGPSTSSSALLNKVAGAAARVPAHRVRPKQFEYVANQIAFGHAKLHERQVWTPVSNLCNGIRTLENGLTSGTTYPASDCPNRGTLGTPTYRLLRSLPTDPHKLLVRLLGVVYKPGQRNLHVMLVVGNLITNDIAPPQVTAALYRTVAAFIPGLRVVPHASDPLGRPGIGLRFSSHGTRIEWVFNPKTFHLLGERITVANDSKADMQFAVLHKAFVNKAGQVPKSH
jgi:hypothetical protein